MTAEAVRARGPAMVFCRTKRGADRLSDRLARSGLKSAAIHGDRSQSQRERALAAFRAGRLDVLVATDVAARGIHVDAVPLVVHFDPPADATDYVHRSGRTGRAGADGPRGVPDRPRARARHEDDDAPTGLAAEISAPDVPSIALVEGVRRARADRPQRPARNQGDDGSGTRTRTHSRPGPSKSGRPSSGRRKGQQRSGGTNGRRRAGSGGKRAARA